MSFRDEIDGQKVKYFRKIVKKWTQRQLADESGLCRHTITRIEKGQTNPHTWTIYLIADALEVDARHLLKD